MKILHSPHHWIAVAAVAAASLFTVSHVHGQIANDNSAVFQGRPVPAGAQSGVGALAGPPQGGLGVQGTENSGIAIRPPSGLRDMPQGKVSPSSDAIALNHAVRDDKDVIPKDNSFAPEQRSAKKKVRKAAKNTREQSKYGVASVQ